MAKTLHPKPLPRAAHALTLLSSAIALTACGGGQSDSASLESEALDATSASASQDDPLATPSALMLLYTSTAKTTATTTTAPKTTTTSGTTTPTTTAAPVSNSSSALSANVLAALTKSASIGSGRLGSSAASNACGVADIGGWSAPVPSKLDTTVPLNHLKQPGSRLFYISSASGNDNTGQMYFWNGSAIVDSTGSTKNSSGHAYGTDPTNPSAAVKRYKRWVTVSPRGNGTDIGDPSIWMSAAPMTRAGYPDWWLFARGETFDMKDQASTYLKEKAPTTTATALAAADSNLTLSGGRSASERQVIGAFGDVCLPRPRFVNSSDGFIYYSYRPSQPNIKNVLYQSIHIDGHGRPASYSNYGLTMLEQTTASNNILFEDVWFDAAMINIGGNNNASITFRRSMVTDAYSPDGKSHMQGVFYAGGGKGTLRIEESILLRNGFRGDPTQMTWPPSGAQTWNIFNRNMYISGTLDSMQSGLFDSVSMLGASGDQFRPGMRVERNFFYQGYLLMGAQGGKPDSTGATGTILDNVLQTFVATGTDHNGGHPGWGAEIAAGANGVEVRRNIFTRAQSQGNSQVLHFKPSADCPYTFATRNNKASHNILDSGAGNSAVQTSDGVSYNSACASPWTFRGVTGNAVSDNILINAKLRESAYVPSAGAIGTVADTQFSNNRIFPSRDAAAAALGWRGPNRTLKSYLQSLGTEVTSADGFPEYFQAARQMQRGKWRAELTAKPLVNHFKTGFGMDPLP